MAETTTSGDGAQVFAPCLAEALSQAAKGRQVFLLWGIGPDGRCLCGHHGAPGPGGSMCAPGKHPIHAGGFKNATTNAAAIVAGFKEHPNANLAIRTGKTSGIFVVDLDRKVQPDGTVIDGRDSLTALVKEHGGDFPENLCMAWTGGGGVHLYGKYPQGREGLIRNSASAICKNGDIRGDGGYVVAPPSRHASGGSYAWVSEVEPPDYPEWFLELLYSAAKKSSTKSAKAKTFKEGGRNDALTSHAGKMRHAGFSENVIRAALLELNRETCTPPLSDDEVGKIAASIATYEPGSERDVAAAIAEATDGESWSQRLTRTQATGQPNASTVNAVISLENDKNLRGRIRYNDRAAAAWVAGETPWHRQGQKIPRPLDNGDIGELQAYLSEMWGVHVPTAMVREATYTVARRNSFDPVKDYLEGLVWDGVNRTQTWLHDICKAEDNEHTRMAGMRFLISAAARTYEPGCKADQVLVLEGEQDSYKSTVAKIFAKQKDWYSDDMAELGSVKTAERIQGRWIIELAELAALNKSDDEAAKAFITRESDDYRGAYLPLSEQHPRRCVFFATVNPGQYLNDPTGARRFWVVRVGVCDHKALLLVVDQLWAEAVVLYKAGVLWYAEDAREKQAHAEAAESAQVEDMWGSKLAPYLAGRDVCTLEDVAKHFDIGTPDFPRYQKNLGAAMKRAGWLRVVVRIPGSTHQCRVWHPAGAVLTQETIAGFFKKQQGPALRAVK